MSNNAPGDEYPKYGYENQYDVRVGASQGEPVRAINNPRPSGVNMEKKGLFTIMSNRKIRVSVLAVGALVLAVGGFSMLMMAVYPSGGSDANVPIVRADKVAFKDVPSDPGGMNIANSDSTVYETFRGNSAEREVENLLEQSGQPMDKLEAFAQQVEDKLKEQEMEKSMRMAALQEEQDAVLQKIEPASGGADSAETPMAKPQTKTFHDAGKSPETIDFIRSVLKEKEAVKNGTATASATVSTPESAPAKVASAEPSASDAAKVADIAPAAGAAVSAGTYTSGLYFVQLASIGDRSRAPSEWSKMQKSYTGGLLSNVNYRVVKADLGAKGVFYRIQAGPFSKGDAQDLCSSIKAQKPGGCLVIK